MTKIEETRELLKQMTEEERLELIRLCNVENDKLKIDKVYLQLIITALIVVQTRYAKTTSQTRHSPQQVHQVAMWRHQRRILCAVQQYFYNVVNGLRIYDHL